MSDPDWRMDFARHLSGVTFHWKRYQRWSETWDHDHCSGCWAPFSEDRDDTLHEGYATGDDGPRGAEYHWVCATCFSDLKPELGWSSPDEPNPAS